MNTNLNTFVADSKICVNSHTVCVWTMYLRFHIKKYWTFLNSQLEIYLSSCVIIS